MTPIKLGLVAVCDVDAPPGAARVDRENRRAEAVYRPPLEVT